MDSEPCQRTRQKLRTQKGWKIIESETKAALFFSDVLDKLL